MEMEPRLAEITRGYLHAMVWGLPGYLLMVNFRCLNDGIAKTKPAMVITFLGLMLNIPLNYIFIYGKLGMPAFGAVGLWYCDGNRELDDVSFHVDLLYAREESARSQGI